MSTIFYSIQPSPFGEYLIALKNNRIAALHFVNHNGVRAIIDNLTKQWPHTSVIQSSEQTKTITGALTIDFNTRRFRPYTCVLHGTSFQQIVWQTLTTIPPGTTVSYSDVARLIGKPHAIRAVATAISHNQIALLIPCHRVICRNNAMGGYRWGVALKKLLIEYEKTKVPEKKNHRNDPPAKRGEPA